FHPVFQLNLRAPFEKSIVNGKPIAAHIYEYTTQISVYPSMKIEGAEKGVVPVQRLFCLKERNQNKINSYHWFFNVFGPAIKCVRSARRWYNANVKCRMFLINH
ncbi:hypothetical protein M405DRAFT_99531, partial [Rhizopogon salebrosus TDB-379]